MKISVFNCSLMNWCLYVISINAAIKMCIHWHWHLFNDTRTKKKIFFKCFTLHVYNAVFITFQIRVTLNIRQNSIVFLLFFFFCSSINSIWWKKKWCFSHVMQWKRLPCKIFICKYHSIGGFLLSAMCNPITSLLLLLFEL